jgi:hypothetical protein
VDHIADRIAKLEQAIDEAVKQAPAEIRVVRSPAGLARCDATTGSYGGCGGGSLSRFAHPAI